ncbi:hypothetical protein HB818_14625 [Listeria booriae]|nr:hypothetical protein [Listeria booriae]MBC1286994.1 hypothetical protein [Listeria booriae]
MDKPSNFLGDIINSKNEIRESLRPVFEMERELHQKIQAIISPVLRESTVALSVEDAWVKNTRDGWAIAASMGLHDYTDMAELVNTSQKNEYMLKYYFEENSYYLDQELDFISSCGNEWAEYLTDAFDLLKQDFETYYKVVFPIAYIYLEAILVRICNKDVVTDVGKKLLTSVSENSKKDESFAALLISGSLQMMKQSTYKYSDFATLSEADINRNTILHGRIAPIHWNKVEFLKVITLLSTMSLAIME